MNAVQFQFGGKFQIVSDIPIPMPSPTQLLVRVTFTALDTSLNQILSKSSAGSYIHQFKEPLYLGYHYCGRIEAVGSNVTDFTANQQVFGFLEYYAGQAQGTMAEYIVVEATQCALKPSKVPAAIASASATEALTALQALRDVGNLRKDQTVLIVGAAGGVGSAGVQISKRLGAHVTAVCSARDMVKARGLGADVVVDRTELADLKETYDVVFDTPNVLSLPFSLLNRGGTYVSTVPKILEYLWGKFRSFFSSKKIELVLVKGVRSDFELLGKWLQDGMQIDIDSTFAVRDLDQALAKQNSKKKGRVVIQVEGGW